LSDQLDLEGLTGRTLCVRLLRVFLCATAAFAASGCGDVDTTAEDAGLTRTGTAAPVKASTLRRDDRAGWLSRNGVSVRVPDDWDGRILYRDQTGGWGVILQIANFGLPANEGLEPPIELAPGKEDPIKAMTDGDVLVTIATDEPNGTATRSPITIADLRPVTGPRVPRGHRLAAESFCSAGSCVRVEVDFGGRSPNAALERRVEDVLASISIE
jgi:hypothetical protein